MACTGPKIEVGWGIILFCGVWCFVSEIVMLWVFGSACSGRVATLCWMSGLNWHLALWARFLGQ